MTPARFPGLAGFGAGLRALLPVSRPPVVAYPIPCCHCQGERTYATVDGRGEVWCAVCRDATGASTGIDRFEFRRAGAYLGSLTPRSIDAEGADELAVRLSRMSDAAAEAAIDAEGP